MICSCLLALPDRAQTTGAGIPTDAQVHIGVLGLFHPHEFIVTAVSGQALVLQAGEEKIVLEKSSGIDSATVRLSGTGVLVTAGQRVISAFTISVAGRRNEPSDFVLAVPKKIARRYHGILEIRHSAGNLIAVVSLDRESAVASVVGAESLPDTPFEALKAQAIAARSYFVSGRGRHHDFDFCDTTHCQFLREPPAPGSTVANAVAGTRGLVLAYDSQPFPAMYTRSCSGHTRTAGQLGLSPAPYPYYSVDCKYCRSHPARWTSRIPVQDASYMRSSDESSRLKLVRRLGWNAIPSNDFVVKRDGDQMLLQGTGQGHGMGLCQAGAKAMAEEGATFQEILSHYYPNSTIINWQNADRFAQSRSGLLPRP